MTAHSQVLLPGKSHGQRNLEGYSPWGHKRVRQDLVTKERSQRMEIHNEFLVHTKVQSLCNFH